MKDSRGLSQKELAEIGRIGQPAMAQMLERMVKDGLLVREPDTSDRRKAIYGLSEAALLLMPQVEATLKEGNVDVFSGFTEGELVGLVGLLQKLERHLASLGKSEAVEHDRPRGASTRG